jgi:hypothetical protein
MLIRIAAIVIIGMVLTFFAFRASQNVNRDLGYMVSASGYPELIEAEKYYSMQTDIYYSKIQIMINCRRNKSWMSCHRWITR